MKAKKKSAAKFVGRKEDKWLFLKYEAIIVHKFNTVINSIANCYSESILQEVLNILYHALKKMLY